MSAFLDNTQINYVFFLPLLLLFLPPPNTPTLFYRERKGWGGTEKEKNPLSLFHFSFSFVESFVIFLKGTPEEVRGRFRGHSVEVLELSSFKDLGHDS